MDRETVGSNQGIGSNQGTPFQEVISFMNEYSLSHFLYFTLYSINYNISYVRLFFICFYFKS
jgi:hypothetical protein